MSDATNSFQGHWKGSKLIIEVVPSLVLSNYFWSWSVEVDFSSLSAIYFCYTEEKSVRKLIEKWLK